MAPIARLQGPYNTLNFGRKCTKEETDHGQHKIPGQDPGKIDREFYLKLVKLVTCI